MHRGGGVGAHEEVRLAQSRENHRQRAQLALERIERQAEGLEPERTKKCEIAFLAEDHICTADVFLVPKHGDALFSTSRRSVPEFKFLLGDRLDSKLFQRTRRHNWVNCAGIYNEFNGFDFFGALTFATSTFNVVKPMHPCYLGRFDVVVGGDDPVVVV